MNEKKIKFYQIELTSRCDATCSYCPHGTMSRKKKDITPDIFEQAIKLLDRENLWTNFGMPIVELHSFGEGLLMKEKLFYYLDRMKEEEIPWSLSSNGILLSQNPQMDKKLLSYDGVLEISIENTNRLVSLDEKVNRINSFLKLHEEVNSKLIIYLIVFDHDFDFSRIYGSNYRRSYYGKHTWGENDEGGSNCDFLTKDYFIVQSNGNIASCCFDATGETSYGDVFNPIYTTNESWRKCKSCKGNEMC
tara:strand:+ start:80 stop:823 length:744 start_codon:yes stop_codon:yes gene_type:complete